MVLKYQNLMGLISFKHSRLKMQANLGHLLYCHVFQFLASLVITIFMPTVVFQTVLKFKFKL